MTLKGEVIASGVIFGRVPGIDKTIKIPIGSRLAIEYPISEVPFVRATSEESKVALLFEVADFMVNTGPIS